MDDIDRAQQREQMDRDLAIRAASRAALANQSRDYAGEICTSCNYATISNFGKTCDAWADCLQDLNKRERAAR